MALATARSRLRTQALLPGPGYAPLCRSMTLRQYRSPLRGPTRRAKALESAFVPVYTNSVREPLAFDFTGSYYGHCDPPEWESSPAHGGGAGTPHTRAAYFPYSDKPTRIRHPGLFGTLSSGPGFVRDTARHDRIAAVIAVRRRCRTEK